MFLRDSACKLFCKTYFVEGSRDSCILDYFLVSGNMYALIGIKNTLCGGGLGEGFVLRNVILKIRGVVCVACVLDRAVKWF